MIRTAAMAVAALLFPTLPDAFVSPSAFTVTGVGEGIRATALSRASGAIRSRPTMNVIDVRRVAGGVGLVSGFTLALQPNPIRHSTP